MDSNRISGLLPLLIIDDHAGNYAYLHDKYGIRIAIHNKAIIYTPPEVCDESINSHDSVYGNTEKIARTIGGAITGDVLVLRAGEVNPSELGLIDLLVVGSPAHWGRPTQGIQDFLNKIPSVKGINVAASDTRLTMRLIGIFGYAAGKIADSLKAKDGTLILSPQGFYVRGKEGPLKEGELECAADWAKGLVHTFESY